MEVITVIAVEIRRQHLGVSTFARHPLADIQEHPATGALWRIIALLEVTFHRISFAIREPELFIVHS